MASITKDHARAIAKKLRATVNAKSKAHDAAVVYDEQGHVVAVFGIRRGSNRNLGHGHLARDLNLGPRDVLRLARCELTREAWLRLRQGPVP